MPRSSRRAVRALAALAAFAAATAAHALVDFTGEAATRVFACVPG